MARRYHASPPAVGVADLPVIERTLENGLKVLILPRARSPLVVCSLFYPVGSYDEPPGKSGLAHFLEHMLFKGTLRFPKGHIDQLTFVAGGQANAETGEDCTHYWFSLPSDRWELALEIEADRMCGARFDPREVEAERQVIGEERARELESAQARLDQSHQALSYLRHPYRNPVLGWPEDVAGIGVEDLVDFYRSHYRPDGAVLVLAGDLEPDLALARVAGHLGEIPRGGTSRREVTWREPRQRGRRSFSQVEPDALPRGLLGWHTVHRGHRDAPALDLLADLLGSGRRSRLWHALVEEDKAATWVEASHAPGRRAGQFFVQVEGPTGADPRALEHRVAEILGRVAAAGITIEELARTRNRLEAGWRWEQEDLAGLAGGIGHAALWGHWRDWQAEHAAGLAVEASEIRRVAATYLTETNLTVGWLLSRPKSRATGGAVRRARASERRPQPAEPRPAPTHPAISPELSRIPVPRRIVRLTDYRPRRAVIPNGLRLIWERRPDTGVVALDLHVDAGWMREAQPGLAYLTSRLLEEGTLRRTGPQLAASVEDVGGALEVSPAWISLRIRAEDLDLALELLAELVRFPAFPAESVAWARERIAADLRSDREDPAYHADQVFRGMVYGGHPLGRDPRGSLRDIARLTRDQVAGHHRRHFVPDGSFLVAVGDLDPRRLKRLVAARFGDWEPRGEPLPPWPPLGEPRPPRLRRVRRPGEQVHIVLGHLGITRRDPDHDALVILDHIFGTGPGFADRLSRIVRDELGLVYTVGGGMTDSADILPGLFRVYAGTMPEEGRRVVAAILDQVRAMHDGSFSDDEVDQARAYLATSYLFDYQTVEQRAERLVELERWGLPLDEPLTWPERIARITAREVRRAAKAHIRPEGLSRVEYGPLDGRGRA